MKFIDYVSNLLGISEYAEVTYFRNLQGKKILRVVPKFDSVLCSNEVPNIDLRIPIEKESVETLKNLRREPPEETTERELVNMILSSCSMVAKIEQKDQIYYEITKKGSPISVSIYGESLTTKYWVETLPNFKHST